MKKYIKYRDDGMNTPLVSTPPFVSISDLYQKIHDGAMKEKERVKNSVGHKSAIYNIKYNEESRCIFFFEHLYSIDFGQYTFYSVSGVSVLDMD